MFILYTRMKGFDLYCTYYVGVVWVCAGHVRLQEGGCGEGLPTVAEDEGVVVVAGGQRPTLSQRGAQSCTQKERGNISI